MIDGESVGVGIITYNRKDQYRNLLDKVKEAADVDFIVTVKNFDIDYQDSDPQKICVGEIGAQKLAAFQVDEKLGIAHNKNVAIKHLLGLGAKHIFIVEDDILLKDTAVFKVYVETARAFGLGHLNFCRSYDGIADNGSFIKPIVFISAGKFKLELFQRLSGDFSYFTAEALEKVGLYDERYINALDHCEHTYRMSVLGFYTPFGIFADIFHADNFIEDFGRSSTITRDEDFMKGALAARDLFIQTYGIALKDIVPPTGKQLGHFLKNKISTRRWKGEEVNETNILVNQEVCM